MQTSSSEYKIKLQEEEYFLPAHWLLKKGSLIHYLYKTQLMVEMIQNADFVGSTVLDVGCGDGRGTHELYQSLGKQYQFTGIDFSERAIAFARLMAPNINFEVQDGKHLDFEDKIISLVVAREVIEHIPPEEVRNFLSEIYRVLQKNGILLLTTPSVNRRLPEKHFQHFSPHSIGQLLTTCGFTVVEIRGFGWWPPAKLEKAYRFLNGLPWLWRIHAHFGGREMDPVSADCLLILARTSTDEAKP